MLTNTNKLDELIQRARQQPENISPVVLAKINRHLQQTGQEVIPLPWAEQTRQPFPPSPWQVEQVDTTPPVTASAIPDGTELDRLKEDYKNEMAFFAANPEAFTNIEHARMYRQRALISMTETAQKL